MYWIDWGSICVDKVGGLAKGELGSLIWRC